MKRPSTSRVVSLAVVLAVASTLAAHPSFGPATAEGAKSADPVPASDRLLNERDPLPGVRTGGVPPTEEVFARLAREGFRTFVDLRPEPELSAAARAHAEAAGLGYVQIPISSDADLHLGTVRALDAVLRAPGETPAVVVCGSGNRSGALLALRAFWLEATPADDALALGKSAGLTRLEPSVRVLLGLPPPPEAAPAPSPPSASPPKSR